MSSFSSNYKAINKDFCIDGKLSTSDLAQLKENNRSILYLATDHPNDMCYEEGGFAGVQSIFPSSEFVPLDVSHGAYKPEEGINIHSIEEYKKFERALDTLERPTALVCKSARRAGAVYTAYSGVKSNLTSAQVLADAHQNELSFVGSAGLVRWVTTVVDALSTSGKNKLFFRQLFEGTSSTYTYLLADEVTKDAILIDPVYETVERDAKLIRELGFNLLYVINTHCHADHVTGTGLLKSLFPQCKSAISKQSTAVADVLLEEHDRLNFGSRSLFCLSTPGHTSGCFTYVLDDFSACFTGDTVLIRGCGRTDFQGGSSVTLYQSVHDKLFHLPDSCQVYPAHDYKGQTASTIGEEKTLNPRLTKSVEEFTEIMANLNLPYPKQIDNALPKNLVCGIF